MVNPDQTLSLHPAEQTLFGRPSADFLFQSVAASFKERAIAIVLTGSGSDGAHGIRAIKRKGGRVLIQDQATCAAFGMPSAALATGCVDFILPLNCIARALIALVMVHGADKLFEVSLPSWASLPE